MFYHTHVHAITALDFFTRLQNLYTPYWQLRCIEIAHAVFLNPSQAPAFTSTVYDCIFQRPVGEPESRLPVNPIVTFFEQNPCPMGSPVIF